MPDRLGVNVVLLTRPGVASIFTPIVGSDQECKTSADVIIIWIGIKGVNRRF